MFDIFALQVSRVTGSTATEIQKMAKRFPVVDATGFAEYEKRKHPDQFHGAGDTSTIGRIGETENRCRRSIYLAVENSPRSGRAERGEDGSLAAVRLGDRLPKANKVVGSLAWYRRDSGDRVADPQQVPGTVEQTEEQQGNYGRPKQGVFQTAETTAWPAALCEVLARNLVAELLKTASASKAQKKGESRGRMRRRIGDDHHDQDRSKGKKAMGDRRKISSEELAKVKSGEALGDGLVYVGRVRSSKDQGSKWANPFRMKRDGNREEVIRK